jgi:hypothetical protein
MTRDEEVGRGSAKALFEAFRYQQRFGSTLTSCGGMENTNKAAMFGFMGKGKSAR